MNDFAITIDTDWAPDEVIAKVANLLIKHRVKTTWFVTHNSQEIQELKKYPELFELGLHPNFAKNSSQGENPIEIMEYLSEIVPGAKSVRTHGLIQSSRLLEMVREEFDILYDVSLLMPHTPNLMPHKIFLSKNKGLLRFPYFWEDDEELNRPEPVFAINHPCYQQPGLKIFNFHPIYIILNSQNMKNYERMKKDLDYPHISVKNLGPYIFDGKGIGVFFQEILKYIFDRKLISKTISDLATEFVSKE